MFVYTNSDDGMRFFVGYYDPEGKWVNESTWDSRAPAARRTSWLNGNGNDMLRMDVNDDWKTPRNQTTLIRHVIRHGKGI